jgi:hypothetical protein
MTETAIDLDRAEDETLTHDVSDEALEAAAGAAAMAYTNNASTWGMCC